MKPITTVTCEQIEKLLKFSNNPSVNFQISLEYDFDNEPYILLEILGDLPTEYELRPNSIANIGYCPVDFYIDEIAYIQWSIWCGFIEQIDFNSL